MNIVLSEKVLTGRGEFGAAYSLCDDQLNDIEQILATVAHEMCHCEYGFYLVEVLSNCRRV